MPPLRTGDAAQLSSLIDNIAITFLGTASALPSSTRNHSSLAVLWGGRGDVWLFDCGEATQKQLQKSDIKMGKIEKVFITHTHGDHIFGLGPLLAGCLNGLGGTVEGIEDERINLADQFKPIEIYGPLGTRAYIRSVLKFTHTRLGGRYVVHELRFPNDPPYGDFINLPPHPCELPGRNIQQTPIEAEASTSSSVLQETRKGQKQGFWKDIHVDPLVTVHAAPIMHSVPCIGYVLSESPRPQKMDPSRYIPHLKRTKQPFSLLSRLQKGENITLPDGMILEGLAKRPGRKIVVLGDTCDPEPIGELARDADLLIHEATNAYLPGIDLDTREDETEEDVEKRTRKRGHSTPQMAGRFATRIGAKKLVLNHFSARYRGDDDVNKEAKVVMDAIKELAVKEYTGGDVLCARDFMTVNVPLSKQQQQQE